MGPIAVSVAGGGVSMEEDDALMVKEALAFIEAFEHEGVSNASTSSSTGPNSPESTTSDRKSCTDTEADKKKRNSLAVRRCQRRKKQEMLELREQVQALEAQLKQLQRVRRQQRTVPFDACNSTHKHSGLADAEGTEIDDTSQAVWMRLAQRELVEHQRSEVLNRQLRAALAKHQDLSAALQSIVRAGSVDAHRLVSLLDNPPSPPMYSSPRRVFSMDYVLADLELAMKKLYIDADIVLSTVQVDLSNERGESRVEVKKLLEYSEYVEISQAVVVPLPMEAVATAIWHGMCAHNLQTEMYCIKMRSSGDTDAHKNYEMVLNDPVRSNRFTLDGISYMKKFEEDHRRLFASSSLVTVPGLAGISFRERFWMELTRSPDNPLARSVLRTCYHLYPEAPALMKPPKLDSPEESELRRTRSFLLQAISAKIRSDSVKIHDFLFSHVC